MREQGRAQRLIAFGCRHLAIGGQMGQERLHLGRTHFARTLPVDKDLLGPEAIVLVAYSLTEPIQHGWTVERGWRASTKFKLYEHPAYVVTRECAGHFQELSMTRQGSSAQLIKQTLLWTLR